MNNTDKSYQQAIKMAAETYAKQLRSMYGKGWEHIGQTAQEGAVALVVLQNAMGQIRGEVDVEYLRDMFAAVNKAMGR